MTNKLLGKYVFKVQALDKMVNNDLATCPTFEVYLDADWVENNIEAQYLATAQKTANDYFQWITPAGQRYDEQGYVDISSLNLTIPLDNDPINKLRYIPPKIDKDGVEKQAAQWFGFCKGKNKKVVLDKLYINDHFLPTLIADVKSFGIKGEKVYSCPTW